MLGAAVSVPTTQDAESGWTTFRGRPSRVWPGKCTAPGGGHRGCQGGIRNPVDALAADRALVDSMCGRRCAGSQEEYSDPETTSHTRRGNGGTKQGRLASTPGLAGERLPRREVPTRDHRVVDLQFLDPELHVDVGKDSQGVREARCGAETDESRPRRLLQRNHSRRGRQQLAGCPQRLARCHEKRGLADEEQRPHGAMENDP